MKKGLAGLIAGLIVGWALGSMDLGSLLLFTGLDHGMSCPDLRSRDLTHFRTEVPAFSSSHFCFRRGFKDVHEYWSFVLPPERARTFLDTYVADSDLASVRSTTDLPDWIMNRGYEHEDWRPELWFGAFADLTEIYYVKCLFCGYSRERNRIFLMNWSEQDFEPGAG